MVKTDEMSVIPEMKLLFVAPLMTGFSINFQKEFHYCMKYYINKHPDLLAGFRVKTTHYLDVEFSLVCVGM